MSSSYEDLSKVPPVPAVPVRDRNIVPGHRIGPVALGMTSAQLYSAMGEPRNTMRTGAQTVYQFADLHVAVLDKTQRVVTVSPMTSAYATPEGVHLQDSVLSAHAAYPNAKWKTDENGGSSFCDPRGMRILTHMGRRRLHRGVVAGLLKARGLFAIRPRRGQDRFWREAQLGDPRHTATARVFAAGRERISYP